MKIESEAANVGLFHPFHVLNGEEKALLNRKVSFKSFPKGQLLCLPGDPSRAIFLILKGKVKRSRYSVDGREIILDFRKAGEIFGELALLGWNQQEDAAEVVEEALIGRLPVKEIQRLLFTHPRFHAEVTQLIGQRLRSLQRRYESLCFHGATSRIKHFIREQADQYGRKVGAEIDLRLSLTHQDIGKITVTSRQTVTDVFNELERNQVISYNRKRILIRNYQSLL